MRKLLFIFLVILFVQHSHAKMSINDVKQTYIKLTKINQIDPPPTLFIDVDEDENAYSNCSKYIVIINTGMLDKLRNRDELARVLGHELGHFMSQCNSGPKYEYLSDAYAKIFLERAGYNTCKAAKYLKRRNAPGVDSHPADIDRVHALGCK